MATRQVITWVCDLCGLTDEDGAVITTHRIIIDDRATEADTCQGCWEGAVRDLRRLAIKGRTPEPPKGKKVSRKVVEWPGTSWHVTSHSLLRMGERKLNPMDVFRVADKPKTRYPSVQDENLMIHVGHGVKVVVDPNEKVIITAAGRDEEVEDVA